MADAKLVKRASSAFTGGGVVKRASSAFTGGGEETRKMRVLPGDGETRKMRVLPEGDVRGGVVKRASSAFTGVGEETRKMRVLPGVGETRKMRVLPDANIRAVVFPDAARDRERHFFSPDAQTSIHKRNLPHWAQDGKLIFVTFRLADSIPQTVLREWESQKEEWMSSHPEPWDDSVRIEYAKSFPEKMQDYLDSGYGACVLADSECRDAVESALEYFNGSRYVLHAYVVMANHVHVLMEIAAMDDYVSVLHSWKSYTAKIINRLCGTSGPVWRKESYDRIIRNARHYDRVVEYIVKKNAQGRMETRKMRVLPEGVLGGTL